MHTALRSERQVWIPQGHGKLWLPTFAINVGVKLIKVSNGGFLMNRLFCIFILLMQPCATVWAAEPSLISQVEYFLTTSAPPLEGSFEVNISDSDRRITFCPDNTCLSFNAPLTTSMNVLQAYAYLYLYYASSYTYLSMTVTDSPPFIISGRAIAHDILNRYQNSCMQIEEAGKAACVLNNLSQEGVIKVGFFSV